MLSSSSRTVWWAYAGLVLAFVTYSYMTPSDGPRPVLGGVFLLAMLLTRAVMGFARHRGQTG